MLLIMTYINLYVAYVFFNTFYNEKQVDDSKIKCKQVFF